MSDITNEQVEARIAVIKKMKADGNTFNELIAATGMARNNIRELMKRHGISIPDAWKPRPTKKHGRKAKDFEPLLSHMRLPASSLSQEEMNIAASLGIHPERAAWLVSCERNGDPRGLAVTR